MSLDLTDWQSKKYTTRDGRPVRILCVDAGITRYFGHCPIVGLVRNEDDTWDVYRWFDGGLKSRGVEDKSDLINAKTKREGWVNIYPSSEKRRWVGDEIWSSEEEAKVYGLRNMVATVKVEWEE